MTVSDWSLIGLLAIVLSAGGWWDWTQGE